MYLPILIKSVVGVQKLLAIRCETVTKKFNPDNVIETYDDKIQLKQQLTKQIVPKKYHEIFGQKYYLCKN